MTYVSHSQVIVRHIESNMRIAVKSEYGLEILKTNIFKGRFVVASTPRTLILANMDTQKTSEIEWHGGAGSGGGTEKFIFDNPVACIVYYAGEVTIVE